MIMVRQSTWQAAVTLVALVSALPGQQLVRGGFDPHGLGCNRSDNVTYELFDPGTFDLDGTGAPGGAHSLEWAPNGMGGLVVDAGGGMLPFGAGVDASAGSQSVSGPWALGFSFAYPGGTTTEVDLDPAGYVYLDVGMNFAGRCCQGSQALPDFLTGSPSFAVLGHNLNPGATGGGTVWFDTAMVGSDLVAYFTWDGVPEVGEPASSNTCQLQLWDDGRCVMAWNGVDNLSHDALVGWSGGTDQPNFGQDDLTQLPIDGGDGVVLLPPTFFTSTQFGFVLPIPFSIVALRPAPTAAALLIGSGPVDLDLDLIGLPGCKLMSTGDLAVVPGFLRSFGAVWVLDIIVPDVPSSYGLQFEVQAVLVRPGVNALGLELTNAASVTVGHAPPGFENAAGGISVLVAEFSAGSGRPTWVFQHNDPGRPNITSITIDFDAAVVGEAVLQSFDVDSVFEPDFQGGNSALPGCDNTYEATDLTTGLVYAGTALSLCDPNAETGWIATIPFFPPFFPGNFRKLSFQFGDFGPGEEFRFGCATRGASLHGDGMDGAIVTIGLADGSTLHGELIRTSTGTSGQLF